MIKNKKIEMLQKFVNLYGINNKLDKVCLYMVHYYISQNKITSYPSSLLPLINKIIFNVDDLQKRIFEDVLLSEAGQFVGNNATILKVEESINERVFFEYSNNFSLSWRLNFYYLQHEKNVQDHYPKLIQFKRIYYEYSSVNENIPDLIDMLRKGLFFHSLYMDEYFFFLEEMVCELIDYYHHDDNFSCRTTHRGYLTKELFEYPEAIKALINFMMELQASQEFCLQRKSVKRVKNRLIKLGWAVPEKNHKRNGD